MDIRRLDSSAGIELEEENSVEDRIHTIKAR